MIVLDASAVVEFLTDSEQGRAVGTHLEEHEGAWHAPGLLDIEVAQVLRRWEATGAYGSARARASLEVLADLPVRRHPMVSLLPRVWELRADLTAYDAAYVALAEALGSPLLTADGGIAGAPGHRAEVVVV